MPRSDDKITILTMMGFGHEAAEASLKRCSSIEVGRSPLQMEQRSSEGLDMLLLVVVAVVVVF